MPPVVKLLPDSHVSGGMSYRDTSEALRAYRERVASDLAAARRAADEASERAKQVKVLEKELSEADERLASMGARKTLPLLDNVHIAAPCKADWDEMNGDDRVRFCGQCEKNVYNLSAMAREEAEAFLVAREGTACVRLYNRADGSVLTADCPVGVRTRRRRRVAAATVGGALMAVAAGMGSRTTVMLGAMAPPSRMGEMDPHPSMGEVAVVRGDLPRDPESTATPEPTPPETATPAPIPTHPPAQPRKPHWTMGAPPRLPPEPMMGQVKVLK